MNEVEKMYENCRIKKTPTIARCNRCWGGGMCVITEKMCKRKNKAKCKNFKGDFKEGEYPPFTTEKQLELIKWLSTKELKIRTNKQPYAVYVGVLGNDNTCFYGCEGLYLEQTLSELINHLWQDLTEEERKQIRNILE